MTAEVFIHLWDALPSPELNMSSCREDLDNGCYMTQVQLRRHEAGSRGGFIKPGFCNEIICMSVLVEGLPVMTSMPPGVNKTLEMPPVCPRSVMRCRPPACSSDGVRVKRHGDAAACRPASSLPPSSLTSHSCTRSRSASNALSSSKIHNDLTASESVSRLQGL